MQKNILKSLRNGAFAVKQHECLINVQSNNNMHKYIIKITCEFEGGQDPEFDDGVIIKEGWFDEVGLPPRYDCYDLHIQSIDCIDLKTNSIYYHDWNTEEANYEFSDEFIFNNLKNAILKLLQKSLKTQSNNNQYNLQDANIIWLFI